MWHTSTKKEQFSLICFFPFAFTLALYHLLKYFHSFMLIAQIIDIFIWRCYCHWCCKEEKHLSSSELKWEEMKIVQILCLIWLSCPSARNFFFPVFLCVHLIRYTYFFILLYFFLCNANKQKERIFYDTYFLFFSLFLLTQNNISFFLSYVYINRSLKSRE